MKIDYTAIQNKWLDFWESNDIYKVPNQSDKPKYYVLDMFPYPSGAGLHVGHPLGYIASDIFSRYKRMTGFNVLHPMGFDAFGLPAEQYAIDTGIHPADSTHDNMIRYTDQLTSLGFSFDWSRKLHTTDPNYYKWTQWIFTLLFDHYYDLEQSKAIPISSLSTQFKTEGNVNTKAFCEKTDVFTAHEWNKFSSTQKSDVLMNYRLAYKKVGYVNWCEALGTVLANDQVKDGLSDRGGHPVVQKAMTQWYLRITAYAERLLSGLDTINWSESLKTIQRNWIGKSEGASIFFKLENSNDQIEIYTTRPDTIYGATYMVLAPEHDLVSEITTSDQKTDIDNYIKYVKSKSELDRMAEKEVTGAFTGAYAINPITNTKIPIWIGEYVLKDYGTGAIMAVPSDDERDNAFATKFDLPIIDVIDKSKYPNASLDDKVGMMINSGSLNGLEVKEAIEKVCSMVDEMGIGEAKVNYKLRDANFSRQRYWGEPFPVSYNSEGIPHVIKKENLPVILPDVEDYKPNKDGSSPLSNAGEWNTDEDGFKRETDVMPAVAGSSWYYLRYMDPNNDDEIVAKDIINYWQDVDLYVGGAEHAVAHLMYARFWHKFLFDLEYVPTEEPFKKLINQGMIQGVIEQIYMKKDEDGDQKHFICSELAKDHNPDSYVPLFVHIDYVESYGSDDSHLNENSIKQFIEWRPEYSQAKFESKSGILQNGNFTPNNGAKEFKLFTHSEVGKMSKSKYNVINPDEVISEYGTDTFRLYEMFLGPIEQSKPWDTQGIEGVSKFVRKLYNLFFDEEDNFVIEEGEATKEAKITINKTIQKVAHDIENFSFNTAISAMMVCVNEFKKSNVKQKEVLSPLVQLIAPFAPFISEDLWERLGHKESIHLTEFPVFDEAFLKSDTIEYPLCVNGKKRATMEVASSLSREEIEALAKQNEQIQRWFDGKTLLKTIVVPNKMVNFVVK